jgi:hypothetical protein
MLPSGQELAQHFGEGSEAGSRLSETIERIRWRLWHGQVGRGLELIGETIVTLEGMAETTSPAAAVAPKVGRLLSELETYVCGQSDIIIDYATARRATKSTDSQPPRPGLCIADIRQPV